MTPDLLTSFLDGKSPILKGPLRGLLDWQLYAAIDQGEEEWQFQIVIVERMADLTHTSRKVDRMIEDLGRTVLRIELIRVGKLPPWHHQQELGEP